MSNLFWLTEAQMLRLEPFFPKTYGRPRVDDRRVLIGIIFKNHNDLVGVTRSVNTDHQRHSTTGGRLEPHGCVRPYHDRPGRRGG